MKFRADSARIYRYHKVHPLVSLDQRRTFLHMPQGNNAPFDLRGAKAGVVINERHRAGIGFYTIENPRTRLRAQEHGHDQEIQFRFGYWTLFYEYYFINTKRWQVGVPIELGFGSYKALGPDTTLLSGKRIGVVPIGTALDVHFKPIRWLSLNAMGGYRFVFEDRPVVLSNWFYAAGVSIPLRYVQQDLRYYMKKRKLNRDLKGLNHDLQD